MNPKPPARLLFLCTGNYYRSRFAEIYFNHLARKRGLNWRAYSRGLKHAWSGNPGPMAPSAAIRLLGKGIFSWRFLRFPIRAVENDFDQADQVVALKESEHRIFMIDHFDRWADTIQYWEIHDVDVDPPSKTLPILENRLEEYAQKLQTGSQIHSPN